MFIYFGYICWSGISSLMILLFGSFWRASVLKFSIVTAPPILYSHQWYISVPFSPHLFQHFLFSVFFFLIVAILTRYMVISNCNFDLHFSALSIYFCKTLTLRPSIMLHILFIYPKYKQLKPTKQDVGGIHNGIQTVTLGNSILPGYFKV